MDEAHIGKTHTTLDIVEYVADVRRLSDTFIFLKNLMYGSTHVEGKANEQRGAS